MNNNFPEKKAWLNTIVDIVVYVSKNMCLSLKQLFYFPQKTNLWQLGHSYAEKHHKPWGTSLYPGLPQNYHPLHFHILKKALISFNKRAVKKIILMGERERQRAVCNGRGRQDEDRTRTTGPVSRVGGASGLGGDRPCQRCALHK